MGKTYRRESRDLDEKQNGRKGKHHVHSNNRKSGGMRILNEPTDEDFVDDHIDIVDSIHINRFREG